MLSLRQPARHPLLRAVARLLIAALVFSLVPPRGAAASIPTPPSPGAPASRTLPELAAQAPAAAEKVLVYVVFVLADPSGLTKSAFGELLAHSGTDPQPYAFTGEPLDFNSGFQDHRARWMHPATGRFTGMDPWEGDEFEPQDSHKYSYAGADPSNRVDPSGLFAEFSVAGALAVTSIIQTLSGVASIGYTAQQTRRRTGFAAMWSNYPGGISADEVYELIGGKVLENHRSNPAGFQNSCALRLSRAMNYGGYAIPYKRGQTGSGSDEKWYFYRVNDIERHVRERFGPPDESSASEQDVSNKKGIILFATCGWIDATGHIDLWDGATCGDGCYWNRCPSVAFWRFEQ